jgi:hypothetical protein
MSAESDFQRKIESLDIRLFAQIASQTTEADKRSLLAIQRAVRNSSDSYVYLEIGSHLGGSIQPHLLDPLCSRIYSIDNRPFVIPDERGIEQKYDGNSTERMLGLLKSLDSDQVRKVKCFESLAKNIAPDKIKPRPQICFIDGEHTDSAVVSDFEFCFSVIDPDGIMVFHDSDLVYKGVKSIIAGLQKRQIRFTGLKLGGSVYAISLRNCPVADDPNIKQSARSARLYFLKSHLRLLYKRRRNKRKMINQAKTNVGL